MAKSSKFLKNFEVSFLGRDRAKIAIEFSNPEPTSPIASFSYEASGCSPFLRALENFKLGLMKLPDSKRVLDGSPEFDLLLSPGSDHVSILMRELVLKAREDFLLPYKEVELCHCRAVPTEVVDRAIISGCHTTQSVARMTSAGTSCGTCKPDTESLIAYRLKSL